MKKLLFVAALALPSFAYADRLGSLKSSVDVPLSTNTILNNTGAAENKTINVTSATVAGRLTVLDTSENKWLKHYSNTAFGPAGFVTQVKTEEQFTTGGAYRIVVSTSESVSLSNVPGQSSVVLTPPSSGGTATYTINLNGNASWIVTPETTTVDSDVNVTGNLLIGENATNTLTVTGPLISQDTIATETGGIAFQGSTVTVDAPPLDALDRVPILNNGELSWPLMANGASIDAYNNFTSSNVFSSTLTITSALDCSGYIDDGMVCWDMDDDTFYIGNGASAQEIGAGGGGGGDGSLVSLSTGVIGLLHVSTINASGTPDATTFLRGDGTWTTPAGSGDMVKAATETITGAKLFTSSLNVTNVSGFVLAGAPFTVTGGSVTLSSTVAMSGFPGAGILALDSALRITTTTSPSGLTIPLTFGYKAAVCQDSTASLGFSVFYASGPTAACYKGANQSLGIASFVDTATNTVQDHFTLPSDWTGAVDAKIVWKSTQTSGNVVWKVRTNCVADAEVYDSAWNVASTVTDATKGTTNQFNTATISGITTTGCAAGEELFFEFIRDPAHASDSLTATADLIGLQFTVRRAL